MAHITLNSGEPGIRGLLRFRPETARPLSELAEVLLRGPGTLPPGERELIAAYVSALNDCHYCSSAHSAYAAAQLPEGTALVEQVRANAANAPVSANLKALLAIASAVSQSGHNVTAEHVTKARAVGATDMEIHDTVLIAAAFCMFNRYVDGLAASAPDDPAAYAVGAQRLIMQGLPDAAGRAHRRGLIADTSRHGSHTIIAAPARWHDHRAARTAADADVRRLRRPRIAMQGEQVKGCRGHVLDRPAEHPSLSPGSLFRRGVVD